MKKKLLPLALFMALSCTAFGQVWSPKAAGVLPANVNVFDVSVVSDQIIWAVCGDFDPNGPFPTDMPMVIRSTDGGETWANHPVPGANGRYSYDIHAFDENTACITTQDLGTGPGRGIFRTTDGGQNWTETLHHVAAGIWVHFFDSTEGVCINAWNIGRTTDGGLTWATGLIPGFQSNEGNILNSAATSLATLGDRLWVGTWKGRVFRSLNRGANWQVFNTGLGSTATILSIDFVDEHNGLALYYFESAPLVYHMARTTDGGEHWAALPNAPTNFKEIAAVPCSKTFVGTKFWESGPGTAISTDHGETWSVVDTTLEIWAPVFSSPELGWVALATPTGANPALYKWSGTPLFGRIYVNQNASGANNGRGWTDAYTDLQTALAAAKSGDEIWVAEGVYKPGSAGSNQTATFLIDKDLKLYGGFAGTECLLSERDIAAHPTVLSGDLNGDDVDDDFSQNRSDNVLHVVQIGSVITNTGILDGFTIRNGHALGAQGTDNRRGGGLLCLGKPTIRQCVFEQNYALGNGGGIAMNNTSGGFWLDGCTFRRNSANEGGGMVISSNQFTVEHCTFTGNATHSGTLEAHGGGIYLTNPNPGTIRDCHFSENTSVLSGAGLFAWTNSASTQASLTVSDCTFENNKATTHGAGISFSPWGDNGNFRVEKCRFEGNETKDGGGFLVYVNENSSGAKISVDSCTFDENHASNNGGALFLEADGKNMTLEFNRCQFTENTAVWECGAADFWATNGATGTLTVDSCFFEKDTAFWAGGIEMGSGWGNKATQFDFVLTNSTFKDNHAIDAGGGLILWTDEKAKANFLVDNCLIEGNTTQGTAGGMDVNPASNGSQATIRRTRIVNNHSLLSGGAVALRQFITDLPFPTDASVRFENCLLVGNASAGATVAADSLANLSFLNCTIAGNTASGGIALTDKSGVTLQNTILADNGSGSPLLGADASSQFTSLGGNLFSDASLGSAATPWDFQDTDPLFDASGDFHLLAVSPALDKGVDLGNLPTTDLDGNPRVVGCPDIGAFESATVVSTDCVMAAGEAGTMASGLSISPNPTGDFIKINLPENVAAEPLAVQVFDAAGQSIRIVKFSKVGNPQTLDLAGLPPGVFVLKAAAGERVFFGKFVKQ